MGSFQMINKKTSSKTDKEKDCSFDLDMTLLDQATWKIPDSAIEAVEMLRKRQYYCHRQRQKYGWNGQCGLQTTDTARCSNPYEWNPCGCRG